jgi:hypothetical protein
LLTVVTYSYLLLPFCFFLLKGKLKDKLLLLLAIYGILFFGLLFLSDYFFHSGFLTYYQGFYTFLEYSIFTYIIWYNIRIKVFKKLMLLLSILFAFFQIIYITTATFKRLDSTSIGIETILVFIYIFLFLYDFSKNSKDTFIYNHYCFWIAVGILIYLGGSFFFYMLINHLDKKDVAKYANLTYIAEIIKNLLFAFSIFIYKKFQLNKIHNHSKNIPNLDMI